MERLKNITKIRINSIDELREGMVIYTIDKFYQDSDKQRNVKLPEINYHRVTTVKGVRELPTKEIVYDSYKPDKYGGEESDELNRLNGIDFLDNGLFGCNHRMKERIEVYHLVNIHPFGY